MKTFQRTQQFYSKYQFDILETRLQCQIFIEDRGLSLAVPF